MKFHELTARIPRAELCRILLSGQDDVLHRLPGDIFAIVAGYRLACWSIRRHGKSPAYADLSLRLTTGAGRPGSSRGYEILDGRVYATIIRRLQIFLRRAAEANLNLKYPARVVFEDDVELERNRRVAIYAKQAADLEAIAAAWSIRSESSPKTKPVWCMDLSRWFVSAAEAADFINRQTHGNMRRSDVRTAIKRRIRCAGLKFIYDGPAEGRPESVLMPCGTERPVVCGRHILGSIAKAAAFAGVPKTAMSKAIKSGALIFGQLYEFAPVAGRVVRERNVRQLVEVAGTIGLFGDLSIGSGRRPPRKRREVFDLSQQFSLFAS